MKKKVFSIVLVKLLYTLWPQATSSQVAPDRIRFRFLREALITSAWPLPEHIVSVCLSVRIFAIFRKGTSTCYIFKSSVDGGRPNVTRFFSEPKNNPHFFALRNSIGRFGVLFLDLFWHFFWTFLAEIPTFLSAARHRTLLMIELLGSHESICWWNIIVSIENLMNLECCAPPARRL